MSTTTVKAPAAGEDVRERVAWLVEKRGGGPWMKVDMREPTDAQINVWSIIRSALSRAWALSRPWAVADRSQITSEVVARLDAIAADCEREVLAALRSEAQGEGWQVAEPARDIVRREMPETRATVREAIRAARRGDGGGE